MNKDEAEAQILAIRAQQVARRIRAGRALPGDPETAPEAEKKNPLSWAESPLFRRA
jgi:hypothetical protein